MTALVTFIGTFAVSYLGTLLLLKRRPVGGFVDVPNERSSHDAPKPRFGGIAIVAAFMAGVAWLFVVDPATRAYWPLATAGGLLFLTGLVDDWRGLSVSVRFLAQVLAALIAVVAGVVIDHVTLPVVGYVGLGWAAAPLTVVFIVASVNFYNFVDGIDGLAGGSAFIASVFLALIAMILGHTSLGLVYLAVAGAAVGFLQFNFPPSRLFMGDGGSTFLGYSFAYLAIAGNRLVPELPVFIPMLILSALYLDAGLTLTGRMLRGEKIFQAHHTHYYQRLLSLGLNHKQVTLLEYLLVVLLGVSAVVYFMANEFFAVFLTACWFVIFAAAILKIRGLERGDRLFWEKRGLFVIASDVVMIVVAYVGAYFLRMNFQFTEAEGQAMLKAMPIVLVVRTACFLRYGLYRALWKYTGVADIVRVIKAVSVGSVIILTSVVLLYRFVAFPRTLFIIEYFLLITLILGTRFAFRLFHEIGREAHGANVRRYAVIGAGDYGERAAREIRGSDAGRAVVSCFIDDDPSKRGMMLGGVPIVGPIENLPAIVGEQKIDALVLGISRIDEERSARIVELAREAGVALESGRSAPSARVEPSRVVFDRLSRRLRRPLPDPGERVDVLRGRRVLVTHGGDRIGSALVRELLRAGASVTVQFDSVRERRAAADLSDDALVYLGPLADVETVRSLVDAVVPDVVYHCVSLDASADRNGEAHLWEEVALTTDRVLRATTSRPTGALVLLSFWGDGDASAPGARMAAVAEAMWLNRTLPERITAAALRVPRVLTDGAVRDLVTAQSRRDTVERTFDVLETEVAAAALQLGTNDVHGLFTPVWHGALTADVVLAATARAHEGDDAGDDAPLPAPTRSAPLYPSEQLQEVSARGIKRVVGPLYPSHDALKQVLREAVVDDTEAGREEWIRAVGGPLYQIVPAGLRFGVDA
jgi:UDP-GlcNAc:undecaprenyl-phosphate GlcNAc-1-phosphate transferase